MVKYFTRGIIFGFLLELMITQTRIYDNIIRSTTMKRLSTWPVNQMQNASRTKGYSIGSRKHPGRESASFLEIRKEMSVDRIGDNVRGVIQTTH